MTCPISVEIVAQPMARLVDLSRTACARENTKAAPAEPWYYIAAPPIRS
jgi:hypothetical protein